MTWDLGLERAQVSSRKSSSKRNVFLLHRLVRLALRRRGGSTAALVAAARRPSTLRAIAAARRLRRRGEITAGAVTAVVAAFTAALRVDELEVLDHDLQLRAVVAFLVVPLVELLPPLDEDRA